MTMRCVYAPSFGRSSCARSTIAVALELAIYNLRRSPRGCLAFTPACGWRLTLSAAGLVFLRMGPLAHQRSCWYSGWGNRWR